MAEGVAGLFGLKSPEESRAAKVQKMMAGLQNSNDPKAILSVASELNKMGLTKEALFLTDRARKLQLENAAETRATAAEGRASALFPLQKREAELGLQDTQLSIEGKTLERDRAAKIDSILSTQPLNQDPATYYYNIAQRLTEQGLGKDAAPYYKLYADASKGKGLDPSSQFTAVDTETGEYVRLAELDGKLVRITPEGPVRYTGKYTNPVQRTSDSTSEKLSLMKFANTDFGPYVTAIDSAQTAVENGREALLNPNESSRAKFEAQLNRTLATLVGDKQLSQLEVNMLVNNGALTERIANNINSYLSGTSTPDTIEGKIEVARVAMELNQMRLARRIEDFDANFGADAVNIDSYRATAGVMSPNASQYY